MPKDLMGDVSPEFEGKVFTIADEVLKILKELSIENKTEINSHQIAERMVRQDSLSGLMNDIKAITEEESMDCGCREQISILLMDKFSVLIPSYKAKKLGEIKDAIHKNVLDIDTEECVDHALDVVKEYIDSISARNNELEDFLEKTREHISLSEDKMSTGLSFQRQRLKDDIVFENSLSSNIDEVKQDINTLNDLSDIRTIVTKKIDYMYNRIELKRCEDMKHIRETEKTLDEINSRMDEIKHEADGILRKTKRIVYEASHDALTGAYNLKAYEKKMREVIADVSRYGMPAALMICNIDFFMNINDRWGHKIGDLILKKMSYHIKERMRINDFISRHREDVFVIILPHTKRDGAELAGERLRSYIDNAEFVYKGDTVPLTVSIGISCFRKNDNMDTVFERARSALCLAKKSGRNRVKIEEEAVVKLLNS